MIPGNSLETLRHAAEAFKSVKDIFHTVLAEEQKDYKAIPGFNRDKEPAEELAESIDSIKEALDSLDDIEDSLEEAIDHLEDAISEENMLG